MDSKYAALVSCKWFVVGCKYWDTDIHRCTQILESLAAALEWYVVCWVLLLGVVCCDLGVGCCRAFGRRSIEDGRPLRYDLVDRVDRVY